VKFKLFVAGEHHKLENALPALANTLAPSHRGPNELVKDRGLFACASSNRLVEQPRKVRWRERPAAAAAAAAAATINLSHAENG